MVDSIEVAPDEADQYLHALDSVFLPSARERGMKLVACWHTSKNIGENVTVMIVFELEDWAHWDELRARSVTDPALYDWLEVQSRFIKRGTRRFFETASFSPTIHVSGRL